MPNDLDIPMPRMTPSDGGYRGRMRAPIDRSTRRLALIAGGIAAVLLLLVGVWSVSGHHRVGGVPVIEADSRPWRSKPDKLATLLPEGQDDGAVGAADTLAPPPETPSPQTLTAVAGKPAATAPVMPTVAAVAPAAPTIAPPVAAAPVTAAPSVAVVMPPAAAPPPATGALVQLGALETEQAAMTEWQRLEHKMPDLLSSRHPAVSKAEHGGRTFFRLRTGGFSDIAQATAFCEQIRAKGTVCTLARS